MRKFSIGLAVIAAVLSVAMFLSMMPVGSATGNGAPSGAHFNLNVIGVPKTKNPDSDMTTGGRIFVPLWGKTYINLKCGDEFKVLDADGTNGNATLQLPDPYEGIYDPATSTATYKIYVRALGKPGGHANITTGFYDELGNYWYSLENATVVRKKGQSVFEDKTLELTTILADVNNDGILERVGLFDNSTYNYFWQYDNYGLKLLQMRFYMV